MDVISNKAIMIGVGVFVTIMITSAIILIMGQVKDVYSGVYKTDVSIQNMFGEYDMYNNTYKTGIDLLNAAKKYNGNSLVTVMFESQIVNSDAGIALVKNRLSSGTILKYETKLYTTIEFNKNDSDRVTIKFRR